MIGYVSALICAIIIFGMALLQLSLVLGVPLGEYVLGGENKVLPAKMRPISITYFAVFTFAGLVYLIKGGILHIGFNSLFINIFIIIFTLFLGYAIVGNLFLTKSKKEKYLMAPLSIIGFVTSIIALFF